MDDTYNRREVLGFGLALLGLPACTFLERTVAEQRSTTVQVFDRLVLKELNTLQQKYNCLDRSQTIGHLCLAMEGAPPEAHSALDELSKKIALASQEGTIEERLIGAHRVIVTERPYRSTTLLTDALLGPYSDCDTRSILLMDAAERQHVPLSYVHVPEHAFVCIGNNLARSLETTVDKDIFFDASREYARMIPFSRDEVVLSRTIACCLNQIHSIPDGADLEVELPALVRAAAYSLFIITNSKGNSSGARYLQGAGEQNIGIVNTNMFRATNTARFLTRAGQHFERSHVHTPNPHTLYLRALGYTLEGLANPDSEAQFTHRAKEMLCEAIRESTAQRESIEQLATTNISLYLSESIFLDETDILIFDELAEVDPAGLGKHCAALSMMTKKQIDNRRAILKLLQDTKSLGIKTD